MKTANNIVLKALGALLIVAGALKGWQLLTESVANNSIWTWRPFMVMQVDFEFALGIWLLSGLFKKAAWLSVLLCFSSFTLITLYKGLTGAESCGSFGTVHINPWLTLFAIDIPSLSGLFVFRPVFSLKRKPESMRTLFQELITPLPSISRFATTTCLVLLVLSVTTPISAFNELAKEYIVVDYPELLIKTGDFWQFACLEVSPSRFSFIDPNSLIKTASNDGFDKLWLPENVPIAKPTLENRVITNNVTYCL